MNGLKKKIQAELKLHPAESHPEMMDYAQLTNEKNQALGRGELTMGSKVGLWEFLTTATHPPRLLPMNWDPSLVHTIFQQGGVQRWSLQAI